MSVTVGRTLLVFGLAGFLLAGCATAPEQEAGGPGPESGEGAGAAGKDGAPAAGEGGGAEARGLGEGTTAEGEALEAGDAGAAAEKDSGRPEKYRVFFDFDSSDIRPEARKLLKKHAEYLKAHPGIEVLLEGHADERGSREYNLGLGERRAKSVRQLLEVNGVAARRLEVISYGEERPLREGDTEEAYAKNRRVRIRYRE